MIVIGLAAGLGLCGLFPLNLDPAINRYEAATDTQSNPAAGSVSSPAATTGAGLSSGDDLTPTPRTEAGLATSAATPRSTAEATETATPTDSTTPTATAIAVALPPPANPVTADVPTPPKTEAAAPPAHITRLQIPAIGVDAPVEIKSLDGNGVMQAPDSPTVVAWYDFSALPEDQGNVVFAGHLDYAGVGPAVFWELEQVQSGDMIDVIEQGGRIFRYQITSVKSYSATSDASQVVASTGNPTITLITCSGSFDRATQSYSQRIVVTGVLVD